MSPRDWLALPRRLLDLESQVRHLEQKLEIERSANPDDEPHRLNGATMEPLWLRAGLEVSLGEKVYWLATDTPVFGEKMWKLERWGCLAEGETRVQVGDLALSLADQAMEAHWPKDTRRPTPRKVVEVRGDWARLDGAIAFEPMRTLRVMERAEDTTKDDGGEKP